MSMIHRFNGKENDLGWEGVSIRRYNEEFEGVTRQVFIGPEEGSNNFHMRYFRLEPGTHSNKESHAHEHGVLILHGHARVQLKDEFFEVGPNDALPPSCLTCCASAPLPTIWSYPSRRTLSRMPRPTQRIFSAPAAVLPSTALF